MSDIYKEPWEQGPKECQAEIERLRAEHVRDQLRIGAAKALQCTHFDMIANVRWCEMKRSQGAISPSGRPAVSPRDLQDEINRLRSIILSGVDCNACRGHGWQEGGSHPVTGAIEQLMCDVCNGLGRVPWTDNHGPKTEHQTDLEYAWEQIAIYENEDNTEIDRLLAENDRLREVAQMIIEEIGSVGPENADEAAKRAVKEIQRLRINAADVLHPNGRCGCAGDGTCQWCQMSQAKEERDKAYVEIERLHRRKRHYECHQNPDPSWEESLDVALKKADELRSLLEECKPYIREGSRLTPTPRRKEEIERWTVAIDLLKRIEEK
jgi:hypothetical protein